MRKSWKLGAVSVALMAALGLFGCSGGDTTEQKADKPAVPAGGNPGSRGDQA